MPSPVPADVYLVEKLVSAFEKEKVAAAYARQLPDKDCDIIERYTRSFNYPKESSVKTKADLDRLGIKTFFCSNVCAMYRRSIYEKLGGFVKHTIFNEDMIFAGKLIQKVMPLPMLQKQEWFIPTTIQIASSCTGTLIWQCPRRITRRFLPWQNQKVKGFAW